MAISDELRKLINKMTGDPSSGDNISELLRSLSNNYTPGGGGGGPLRLTVTQTTENDETVYSVNCTAQELIGYVTNKTPLEVLIADEEEGGAGVLPVVEYFSDEDKGEYGAVFVGVAPDGSVEEVLLSADAEDLNAPVEVAVGPVGLMLPTVGPEEDGKVPMYDEDKGDVRWRDVGPFFVHLTVGAESNGIYPVTMTESRYEVDEAIDKGREVIFLADVPDEKHPEDVTTFRAPLVAVGTRTGSSGKDISFYVKVLLGGASVEVGGVFAAGQSTGSCTVTETAGV